jgi:Flp pilus assembly protein TadB
METGMIDAVIFAILTTGGVLIAIQLARLARASMQHRTIREAISRDSDSVTALLATVDQDQQQQPSGTNDERTGFVLVALGAAVFLYSLIQNDPELIRTVGGAAAFPILVGAALLARFYVARRRERKG